MIRAIGIFFLILSLNASFYMMGASGMNDVMGVNPDTGGLSDSVEQFDKSQEHFSGTDRSIGDYLGFTISAVTDFIVMFGMLGALESAFYTIGFPDWFVFPLMNFVARPIYTLAAIQIIRGWRAE